MKQQSDALQAENTELLDHVISQRKEILGLVQGLERVVTDLDLTNAVLGSPKADIENLRTEMRDADEAARQS